MKQIKNVKLQNEYELADELESLKVDILKDCDS